MNETFYRVISTVEFTKGKEHIGAAKMCIDMNCVPLSLLYDFIELGFKEKNQLFINGYRLLEKSDDVFLYYDPVENSLCVIENVYTRIGGRKVLYEARCIPDPDLVFKWQTKNKNNQWRTL